MDVLPDSGKIEDFCGKIWWADCMDLLAALPDKSVDMILTDFPYQKTQAFYDQVDLDFVAIGKEMFRVIRLDGAVISTAAQPFTSKLVMLWEKQFQYEWIWHKSRKTNFLNAKKMPLSSHESILVFGHKLPRYFPQMIEGDRHETRGNERGTVLYGSFGAGNILTTNEYYPETIIDMPHDGLLSVTRQQRPDKLEMHPNAKPVKLWEYLLKTYTLQGEIILDPFCGGGVTAIACTNLDRRFVCGELHEPYVAMGRERLQRHNPFLDTTFKSGDKQLSLFKDLKP